MTSKHVLKQLIVEKRLHVLVCVVLAAWHYKEALRVDPDYPKAHNNLGNLFMRQGRINEAIKHYKKALSIGPCLQALSVYI